MRTQCKNVIKLYSSRAYCYFTCVRNAMAIERVELHVHVEFRDRLQTLIDCAHEQDGNFHDRWRQISDAFTSATIEGAPSTRTYAYTIIYSC